MENYKLDKDINLFCVKADSFPEGISDAHKKLASISDAGDKKSHFGVSYWYDDGIQYMAAAEMGNNSEIPAGCERYTLRKGNYISITLSDFAEDTTQVGKAFKELLADPGIDENGCCAECYLPEGTDFTTATAIRCMVRLAD